MSIQCWKYPLVRSHIALCNRKTNRILFVCLISSSIVRPTATFTLSTGPMVPTSNNIMPPFSFIPSSPDMMLHTRKFKGTRTRQNVRLMQSISNNNDAEDDGGTRSIPSSPEKKRKATPNPPSTPSRSMRSEVKGVRGIVAIPVTPDKIISKETSKEIPKEKTLAKKIKTLAKKPSPQKKQKKSKQKVSRSPPAAWQEIYSLVEELRQDRSAPVDTDGSEALPDKSADPKTYRFQILIALMLSSQTKDAVVGDAIRALQKHGLTVDTIAETLPEDLNALIRKVGFHNNKSKYIKQSVEILRDQHNGDIPPTADSLMDLPGVGPKMAYIVENIAWNKQTGIGVDTHMHRIFNELKWVESKNPEQTRVQLESWLPFEYWESVNLVWVGMGQEVQQFKPKLLRKVLDCSRPNEALKLVKRLGLDYTKEGKKLGLTEEIQAVLKNGK